MAHVNFNSYSSAQEMVSFSLFVEALNSAGGRIPQEEQGLLPEVALLAFSLRMHYFKPKSAMLAATWGQFGKQFLP